MSIGNNYRRFEVSNFPLIFRYSVQFDPKNKGNITLRYVGNCLPSDKLQHSGRHESSDCVSITKKNPLMLHKINAVVYSDNSGEQVSTLCGQNAKTVSIKRSGIYAQKQLSFNEEIGAALYRNVLLVGLLTLANFGEGGEGAKGNQLPSPK